MATMREVADLAGVAPSTVSRVLTGSAPVSPAIRDKVLRAIAETNYRPNLLGRTLRTSKTRTIAFILPELAGWANIEAIRFAEMRAQDAGYATLIAYPRNSPEVELELLDNLTARRIDGALCTPINDPLVVAKKFHDSDIPVVFLFSRPIDVGGRSTTAVINDDRALQQSTNELVKLGHRHIGLVLTTHPFLQAAAHEARLDAAVRRTGVTDHRVSSFTVGGRAEDGFEQLVAELMLPSSPTALYFTEMTAPVVLTAIREAKLRPGIDVSLVAIGDSPWLTAVEPPISSISVDVEAFVSAGVRALMELLETPGATVPPLVHNSKYIPRRSVSAPADRSGRGTGETASFAR